MSDDATMTACNGAESTTTSETATDRRNHEPPNRNPSKEPRTRTKNIEAAVFECATEGDLEGLRLLLETGSDNNENEHDNEIRDQEQNQRQRQRQQHRHRHRNRHPPICLFSLRDSKGATPLHYAAGNGHLAVCRFLLETVRSQKASASASLSAAAAACNDTNYADIPTTHRGRTALHWAARNGHAPVCRFLVSDDGGGASVDALAGGGVTPLQLAVWMARVETCVFLERDAGADKEFVNGWGCSVRHWLGKSPVYAEEQRERRKQDQNQKRDQKQNQQNQHDEQSTAAAEDASADKDNANATATDRLLALCHWLDDDDDDDEPSGSGNTKRKDSAKDSSWNRPNAHGQTPLHKAGFGGNLPVIRFLLHTKHVTDCVRDSQHNTAADCAERNRQWEAARYLRRHGNPGCLQTARTVLFGGNGDEDGNREDSNSNSHSNIHGQATTNRPPTLAEVKAAYHARVRVCHPDRRKARGRRVGKPNGDSNPTSNNVHDNDDDDDTTTNTTTTNSNNNGIVIDDDDEDNDDDEDDDALSEQWAALQRAYRLWTLWWRDPDEADALIRSLERHEYLQRDLPPLLLWHENWHNEQKQQRERRENQQRQQEKQQQQRNPPSGRVCESEERCDGTSAAGSAPKSPKRRRVDRSPRHGPRRAPAPASAAPAFSPEALERLLDFERRLVRLLGTLPDSRIPLSQLPKEYQKTWGDRAPMIRPRDYRCKKLGFLLSRHCSRTVEVVHLSATTTATTIATATATTMACEEVARGVVPPTTNHSAGDGQEHKKKEQEQDKHTAVGTIVWVRLKQGKTIKA